MKFKMAKLNSLRTKLFLILLLLVTLPLVISSFINYQEAQKVLFNKLQNSAQDTTKLADTVVDYYLVGIQQTVETLAQEDNALNFYDIPGCAQWFGKTLDNTQKNNPNLAALYIGTVRGEIYLYPKQQLPPGYDPRKRGWYQQAMASPGKAIWTEPYVDAFTGKMVVTVARMVEKNGKPVGVVAADIFLDELGKKLTGISIGKTGYIFILDSKGNMIAHKNSSYIGKSFAQYDFVQKMLGSDSGFFKYNFKGEDKYVAYKTQPRTGWKVAANFQAAELTADTGAIRNSSLMVLFLAVIILIFIASWVSNFISKPIQHVVERLKLVAEGDLTLKLMV